MNLKLTFARVVLGLAAFALLNGCDSGDKPAPAGQATPDQPTSSTPKPAEVHAPEPSPQANTQQTVADTQKAAGAALDDLSKQLSASIQPKSDTVLNDLSKELTAKVQTFTQALGSEEGLKSTVQSALQSLAENKDLQSLEMYQKVAQAKLTPEQTKLAGEVRDLWSAFAVQKNFASLAGAQGEVGQIVTALRSADTATALTHLKQLASNASLSAEQKNLLTSLAGQYGASLQDAGKALQDGLKGLNPLKTP